MSGTASYRMGAAIAVLVSLLTIWMRVVGSEENPANLGYFAVVFAAAACAFTARLRAEGMARGMFATAGVQALIGAFVATAPITATIERYGVTGVVIQCTGFVTLWLIAAAFFHRGARPENRSAMA